MHHLQANGFIDQHDRNIIFNWIQESASFAHQTIAFLGQVNVSFAFGTSQDVQKILADRHVRYLLRIEQLGKVFSRF